MAHDPKKHGVTMLYSSLGSGHPLVQRCLCSSKCADSIHNSSKLPRTDMNMLQRLLCCVGRVGSVSRGWGRGRWRRQIRNWAPLQLYLHVKNKILSPLWVLCYLICYILLVLLLENKRDRHVKRSLRGQDLSAADPPLDARLLREPQMLRDLAQQSRHQQR